MRTYLFDTINRYKRFSENLDVSATLCNKSWWVFNDEGVKSLYIFQPNGDLYITTNGVGLKGSWQYISANKTVIINSENAVMMFHPVFIDSNILTLTLDGTQKCAFLIDENNRANFVPRSLSDLTRYFQNKEQKEIEAKRKEQARKRAEEEARKRAEEEARKRAEEEAKKRAEEEARKRAEEEARKRAEEEARKRAEEEARKRAEERDSSDKGWVGSLLFMAGGIGLFMLATSESEADNWELNSGKQELVFFIAIILFLVGLITLIRGIIK